jgi:hypothetical protein
MAVSLPAFAHLVTVFGSTRKSAATSAGDNKTSWEPEFLSKATPFFQNPNVLIVHYGMKYPFFSHRFQVT